MPVAPPTGLMLVLGELLAIPHESKLKDVKPRTSLEMKLKLALILMLNVVVQLGSNVAGSPLPHQHNGWSHV